MTMLERIAKAIGKTIPGRSELTYVTPATLLAAEAALDAMLEPTEGMLGAMDEQAGQYAYEAAIRAAKAGV